MVSAEGSSQLTIYRFKHRADQDTCHRETVADTFGLTEEMSITERFVSRKPAEITDGTVKTGSLTLKASAGADVTVHEEEGVWCIDYALTPGVRSFTLTVEVDG